MQLDEILNYVKNPPHIHVWGFDEEVDPNNYVCEECAELKSVEEFEEAFDKREDINAKTH